MHLIYIIDIGNYNITDEKFKYMIGIKPLPLQEMVHARKLQQVELCFFIYFFTNTARPKLN